MSHRKRKRRGRAKTAQKAMRMAKASATKRKVTTCTPAAARKNCPAARLRAAMLPMVIGPIHMVIKAPRHSTVSYTHLDMTQEEALTMIIASIAMEELALSHILNAEGEKLQYILGTLPGTSPCACPHDVLAVNKSVTALVEAVTQNQMLLKNKLAQVLEFCPLPSPPPPACKPEPGPCLLYTSKDNHLFWPGRAIQLDPPNEATTLTGFER